MLRNNLIAVMLTVTSVSFSGVANAGAKDAIDPDCTVEKAAKGAAMKATVGVGNRCDAGETARDVSGVDGKADDAKDAITPKPGKKLKN